MSLPGMAGPSGVGPAAGARTGHPVTAAMHRRLAALLQRGPRVLLGLAGAPGAGKSTLAAALAAVLPPGQAVVVPMDGFHLAQCELERLGRAQRKGAPDTFDVAGFAALLRRLRQPQAGEVVYAPAFRREIEEPVAGAIAVPAELPLVIVEGNYLLLDEPGWRDIAALLDETWYLALDDAERRARLEQRHRQFGRSAAEAAAWVRQTDEPNARRVAASKSRAHAMLRTT